MAFEPEILHIIIIGGGAAGIFCAVNAARMQPQARVIVLEKSNKLLSKVKVSGGGRCNVTHACFSIGEMVKRYPRGGNFLKKAFRHFFTTDTIEWFKERGVELKTEADGRMFPVTDDSDTIIRCLLDEAARYGVEIKMNAGVTALHKRSNKWETVTTQGAFSADAVVVACGGFPKPDQFMWLEATGHSISPPLPSLFTFNSPGNPVTALMGVSTEGIVKIAGTRFSAQGPVLITHWGLSGPAVLKLSAFAARELAGMQYNFSVVVNWLPGMHEQSCRDVLQQLRTTSPAKKMINANPFSIPARLWHFFLADADINETVRVTDVTAKNMNRLARSLTGFEISVKGKTTFKEEFVTAGGILTGEVEPDTMQSRLHSGLYFAGEILDVDGITGGYNFQHAWTSGWIAAKHISRVMD